MAGVQLPTKGTVLFYGKDVREMSKDEFMNYRRSVQYIPQDPYSSFNPPFKSMESILMDVITYYKIADRRRAYSLMSSILKDLQLEPDEVLDKYPHQLSGGQLQRIAIARALLIRPKVIIADEIVSMLDASLRVDLIDLLKQVQREYGLSVVFITHDIALARYFAINGGELVVMHNGRIVERGRTNEVIENPRDSYTKLLLSSHLEPSLGGGDDMPSFMHEVLFYTLTALLLLSIIPLLILPPNNPARNLDIVDLIIVLAFWLYILFTLIREVRRGGY